MRALGAMVGRLREVVGEVRGVGAGPRREQFGTGDDDVAAAARRLGAAYQDELAAAGFGPLTTEFGMLAEVRSGRFFYAEDHHQQYLLKNPGGYDCHVRSGVACPI